MRSQEQIDIALQVEDDHAMRSARIGPLDPYREGIRIALAWVLGAEWDANEPRDGEGW